MVWIKKTGPKGSVLSILYNGTDFAQMIETVIGTTFNKTLSRRSTSSDGSGSHASQFTIANI